MTCTTSGTTLRRNVAAATAPRTRAVGMRGGFALLSVMVAVVLLATGVMAIGAANTVRLKAVTKSTVRSTALNLARGHLEVMRGRDPWSLATQSAVAINDAGVPTASGPYTRQLNVTEVRSNLIKVEVIVTSGALSAPVSLVTNIYRGGTMTPSP